MSFDSHGLQINATNASLQQILNEVSKETGAKVEGFAADERIFGQYGPGQPKDVLSQLLHGSSYNFIMVGGGGEEAPKQLLLSARRAGGNAPTAATPPTRENQEDEVMEQPEPEEPLPLPQPINRAGPPRTPQQVMQELQQRQQMMQQREQGQPIQPIPQPDQQQ